MILDLFEPLDAREWVGDVAPAERAESPEEARMRRLRAVEVGELAPANSGALRPFVPPRARPAWMDLPGVEVLPPCRWCGSPTVWRGSWECDACFSRHAVDPKYSDVAFPRSLPPEALAGVPMADERSEGARVFSSGEGDNSTRSNDGKKWGAGVEALTSFGRRALAARLMFRGAKASVDGPVLSPWHGARVMSLAHRWRRIAECGALILMAEHESGKVVPVESHCGDWRACWRCRDRRRYALQRDGQVVEEAARRIYARQCSKWYGGKEGRWSERMITLTVPHSGSVAEDARLYREAWPKFLRRLTRHFTKHRGLKRGGDGKEKGSAFPWRRALEVATTAEGGAHFHGHIWLLSPFVDGVLLHVWWGQALLEAGCPQSAIPVRAWNDVGARDPRVHGWLGRPESVPWPVVDVRGGQMADYVGKVGLQNYVVKSGGVKESLSPVHAANAYEALSGIRVVQWAMGWAPGRGGGWRVRRATQAERDEWYARLSAALGVASDGNCVETQPSEAPQAPPEAHPWYALDGPEKATAPINQARLMGAEQLSLSWGRGPRVTGKRDHT